MALAELVNPLMKARKVRADDAGTPRPVVVLVRLPDGSLVPAAGWELTGAGLVIETEAT